MTNFKINTKIRFFLMKQTSDKVKKYVKKGSFWTSIVDH